MGYPKTLKEEELQEDNYEYGLEQTYYQMKNTNKQDTLDDYTYVKIETNKNKNIADQGNFKGRGYKIYEKEAKLKDQELKYTYKYGAKGNQKTPIEYNEQITGMTLLGEVEKTDKEEVNINLRIDKGKKGQYPYPFRPETGNMLYNMPQKGTTVSLYMPNHDERFAMIINSIRQNTSQDMTDPSKRTFTTEHGKKLDLYPNQIKLQSKTTGTKISLDDPDAINLNSHKNINIIAKEEILLKAKVINIDAKEELNLIKGDIQSGIVESSITESIEIDTKAKDKTQITGTKVENYATIEEPLPVQEEPPKEEKFDWKKLGKNILAGLAVVGAVTAVAAVTVATGGAALAAAGMITAATAAVAYTGTIVGALLGGIALVGTKAVGDVIRGEVSSQNEYEFAAFTGAVTGAVGGLIPGSTALWIGVGGGVEGAVERFIRGEDITLGNVAQDIFLSMATAGILDNVARKIKKAGAYKVAKEKVEKQINKIVEPVVDTFNRGVKKVIPEGIAFSPSKIDDTLGKESKNLLSNFKEDFIENFEKIVTFTDDPYKVRQFELNNGKEKMQGFLDEFKKILKKNKKDTEDISKICVSMDVENTNLMGKAGNGIWHNNQTIIDHTGFKPKDTWTNNDYINYYRSLLSDEYIDKLPDNFFEGKNKELMKEGMSKLRADIERTGTMASKAGKFNKFGEPSFEKGWNIDNCAEVWACRDAILNGANYDNLVFRTEDLKGIFKKPCKNCKKTFKRKFFIK